MTNDTSKQNTPAPKEIDTAALDQVVGAGVAVPDLRKQEQADKLTREDNRK